MLNTQKADTFALGRLLDLIRDGAFVIPDFQREFAWHARDVRDLVQSVFLDYYIGNLLLWESSPANEDALACEGLSGFNGDLKSKYIVLDGQQRLTALHYAFFQPDTNFPGRKNPYLFFIRIDKFAVDRDDPEAFYYYRKTAWYERFIEDRDQQYAIHTMPLTTFVGRFDMRDWLDGYKQYWDLRESEEIESAPVALENTVEELKEFFRLIDRDYMVSYITLVENVDLAKVCEIFTKINSKGVRLDTFDLLNAITKPKGIQLKKLHREAQGELTNYYADLNTKSYVLMVMSIMEQTYCSPKYLYYLVPGAEYVVGRGNDRHSVVLVKDASGFEIIWSNAVDALTQGVKMLRNPRSYGAIKESFLPYPSMLPVFSTLQLNIRKGINIADPALAESKIQRWYWSAVFGERYSSSVEATTAGDYQRMKRWLAGGDEPSTLMMTTEDVDVIDFKIVQASASARYRAVFNLMVIAGSRDWVRFTRAEDGDLDDHHILPRARAKELEIEDEMNSILNRVPISPDTNRNIIRDRLPSDYLKEMFEQNDETEVYDTLERNLVSRDAVAILMRVPFTAEDFQDFLSERERTVKEAIKEAIS